ncbi:MAG TPA: cyclase family protein [Pyrinomonadaceae bacterium]|nr:cyclase family protein [Pyrinomonadaceae bacterium]
MTLLETANYYAFLQTVDEIQMQIFDVSVPLSELTPTYPGDPGIEIKSWHSMAGGDAANVSLLHFGAHSGTHVDAPAHFIEGGSRVDSIALEHLVGLAEVIEVPSDKEVIDENFVSSLALKDQHRILFKTRNSSFWEGTGGGFRTDYTYLSSAAAKLLVDAGIKLVGIDYLSIEKFQSGSYETHLMLLSHGVTILEGLDLRRITAGSYELICLPLKIAGGSGDGAPARALLRTLG